MRFLMRNVIRLEVGKVTDSLKANGSLGLGSVAVHSGDGVGSERKR